MHCIESQMPGPDLANPQTRGLANRRPEEHSSQRASGGTGRRGGLKIPSPLGGPGSIPGSPIFSHLKIGDFMSRIKFRNTVCFGSCLVLLFLVGCQSGGAGSVRLRGESWSPTPGGAIRASELGSVGDLVDLEGDLGLGEEETVWVYSVEGDLGLGTVEATSLDFSTAGTNVLTGSLDFGGTVFDAAAITSDFNLSITSLKNKGSLFGLGPIGLKYIWGADNLVLDSTISGTVGGVAETATETMDEWIPTFGLGASYGMPIGNDWGLELDAEVSGLWISYGDIDGTYQGTTLRAGLRQGAGMLFGIGHRSLIVDIQDDGSGTSADLDLGGTYLFLEWAI